MRRIVLHEFMSLDGVIQAPGGADEDTDGGFQYGGWTIPYWHDDIGARFFETAQQADAMLLGRKTWEIHSVFDKMDDPFAQVLNGFQKYVVSSTLESPDQWQNTTILRGDPIEEVRKLKETDGRDILIDGSSVLVQALAANGLIDEYQMHVYPVSLGGGKKLFPEGARVNLKLVESKALPTGVVFQKYVPDAS